MNTKKIKYLKTNKQTNTVNCSCSSQRIEDKRHLSDMTSIPCLWPLGKVKPSRSNSGIWIEYFRLSMKASTISIDVRFSHKAIKCRSLFISCINHEMEMERLVWKTAKCRESSSGKTILVRQKLAGIRR